MSVTETSQTLTGEFIRLYPDQVAHILEELPVAETARLIEATAPSNAAGLLERLNPRVAAGVIAELSDDISRATLKEVGWRPLLLGLLLWLGVGLTSLYFIRTGVISL